MKLLITSLLLAGTVFANNFEKNESYECLNTYVLKQGERIEIDKKEANKNPFIFTIKEEKLITKNNMEFMFMMKKGPMSSYSNPEYMLLLTPNLEMGIVPKKARGQIQYYFKCFNK